MRFWPPGTNTQPLRGVSAADARNVVQPATRMNTTREWIIVTVNENTLCTCELNTIFGRFDANANLRYRNWQVFSVREVRRWLFFALFS